MLLNKEVLVEANTGTVVGYSSIDDAVLLIKLSKTKLLEISSNAIIKVFDNEG